MTNRFSKMKVCTVIPYDLTVNQPKCLDEKKEEKVMIFPRLDILY